MILQSGEGGFDMRQTGESHSFASDAVLEELLRDIAQKRDMEALSKLYMLTKDGVFGFAFSILKNVYDAEDVLQDCYVNIFNSAKDYRFSGKPRAWILTITRNLCYLKFRDMKKRNEVWEEDWEKYLDERESITSEDKMVLETCMKCLNEEEQQIVVLHIVLGLKHREIASVQSMNLSTVLSKYNRALKKMKKFLEKGGLLYVRT